MKLTERDERRLVVDIGGRSTEMILGKGAIAKLRIVQGPVRTAAKAAKPPPRRKAPLDAGTEAALAKGLDDAPEGPLKAALLKLGREVLRSGPHGGGRGGDRRG